MVFLWNIWNIFLIIKIKYAKLWPKYLTFFFNLKICKRFLTSLTCYFACNFHFLDKYFCLIIFHYIYFIFWNIYLYLFAIHKNFICVNYFQHIYQFYLFETTKLHHKTNNLAVSQIDWARLNGLKKNFHHRLGNNSSNNHRRPCWQSRSRKMPKKPPTTTTETTISTKATNKRLAWMKVTKRLALS